MKVAVIMSTYNGEKFLREQLDSVLNQINVDVELFVRDDGSSDGTKGILCEYADKFTNIHLDFADNIGVGNSFMNLLYTVPATFDFYSLADQDDIWDQKKLIEGINYLKKCNALLYASNQECVDKNGNTISLRYEENQKIHLSTISILSENMLAGCTMILSNKLFCLLINEESRPSPFLLKNRIHDVWIAAVASLYEGIAYDTQSFIKYRQHENNVVGATSSISKKVKERIKKICHSEYRNGRSLLAKEVVKKFPDEAEAIPLLKICAQSNYFKGKMKLLKNGKELRAYTGESRFGFFCKVMLGLF